MRIVDGYIILDEYTIFLPRCNECEYSESSGPLFERTLYCNF